MRLAGSILLASSAVEPILWAVERSWGFTAAWTAALEPIVQAMVGVGLLWLGPRVVAIGLAFAFVAFATTFLRPVFSLYSGHPAVQSGPLYVAPLLAGPMVFGAWRALPFVLLLTGTQTIRRRNVAAIAFLLWLFLYVAARGLRIYSFQYFASQ